MSERDGLALAILALTGVAGYLVGGIVCALRRPRRIRPEPRTDDDLGETCAFFELEEDR